MSVATMLWKAAPGRSEKQVTGVRMPHGASGPSGAFLFPADLGGMGKLTGFPNACLALESKQNTFLSNATRLGMSLQIN